MISNRQFGAVNSYADRRFIPIRSIIVLARYVYASAWECQFSRRRFFWERLGTPGLSPACFFPGRPYPLTGLPLCSPSPLCELALKFFIQAYFLCVLSVFSVFSARARSFALNPGILSLCPLCEPFLVFEKHAARKCGPTKRRSAYASMNIWGCFSTFYYYII